MQYLPWFYEEIIFTFLWYKSTSERLKTEEKTSTTKPQFAPTRWFCRTASAARHQSVLDAVRSPGQVSSEEEENCLRTDSTVCLWFWGKQYFACAYGWIGWPRLPSTANPLTPTSVYLWTQHHPLQHKLGVIRALMHRAETFVTEEEDKVLEIEKIRKALRVCGYKRSHFAVANTRNPLNRQSTTTSNTNRGSVVIPYVRGVSEGIRRVISSRGVTVHFKPRNT